eukprot:scaffold12267_cov120-Isochrysis_galbana.AAC.5
MLATYVLLNRRRTASRSASSKPFTADVSNRSTGNAPASGCRCSWARTRPWLSPSALSRTRPPNSPMSASGPSARRPR